MNKVSNFQKRKNVNIGIIIFGIIFIYLIATIIMYITAPKVSVYEVRQGSILKDNAYTGFALREETVIYADESGYANYYADSNSKVRVGTNIYTISDNKIEFKSTASDEKVELSTEETRTIFSKIQSYNTQFHENNFDTTYQLRTDLESTLNKFASQSKSDQLEELLSTTEYSDMTVAKSELDGIIVYAFDGLEKVTVDTVTMKQLQKNNYKNKELLNNAKISAGQPIYKMITSDHWKLLVPISEETKDALAGKKTVKVHFKKDNQEIRTSMSYLERMEEPVLCLSFNDSMIRYIDERYLDIELILEDETGLKIPKSAETSKHFYVAPKSYLTQGGNSSSEGVLLQTTNDKDETITQFKQVTIYYEEDEMIYLDPNTFEKNAILIKPDSNETFSLTEKRSLKGVYCINKGYAVFKQIQILFESDNYYIIEEGNSFGLSNYDHIALDSTKINENDVVFK